MSRGSAVIAGFCLALAAPAPVAALPQSISRVGPPSETGRVLVAAVADVPPSIDGLVGDDEWRGAARAEGFLQFEPQRGAPATRGTVALLLHDAEHIYVAFRVDDDAPPAAQLTRRDADLLQDDAVVVILDTFHDRQSAYYFMVNPLGTQTDGRIANDGRTNDANWDGGWRAASRAGEGGWTAEIEIPLASLKYTSGDAVAWGVNFGRSRRASLELSFWAGPLENRFRVSQAGSLTGLRVPAPPRGYQVIPYGQSVVSEGGEPQWNAGVDARYELTTTTTAFATLNPDFALIEADQERINLTRFELSLREKRQFFIEGNELFQQRIQTFYSRRIADITAGAKILGKEGPWTIAGQYARAEPADDDRAGDYGVARLQRDLGRSSVAFMAAGRTLDGVSEGSVGFDTTLFFTETFGLTGQIIESYGRFGDGTTAAFIRPSYDSATGHAHIRFTYLGDHFRENANAVGFVRDDNRRELDSAFHKIFWPASGPLERINIASNYNIYWAADSSILRQWEVAHRFDFDFRNRFSAEVDYVEQFIRFEKGFTNRSVALQLGYNTREFESVRAGYTFGRNFDADFDLWKAAAAYKVTDGLSVEYELEYLLLDPDPDDESTWIHVVRANQFFTPDLFVKVFLQTNSAIDRRNVQLTFVYRYQPPFGTLQLAYQRGTAAFGERSAQDNTLFFKATTVF